MLPSSEIFLTLTFWPTYSGEGLMQFNPLDVISLSKFSLMKMHVLGILFSLLMAFVRPGTGASDIHAYTLDYHLRL